MKLQPGLPLAMMLVISLAPTGAEAGPELQGLESVPYKVVFEEEWDDGLGGWHTEQGGASTICDDECYLNLHPYQRGAYTRVIREDLDIPMERPTTLAFDFQGSTTSGDTDANFVMTFGSSYAVIGLTDGVRPNNGLSLITRDHEERGFYHWPAANQWYTMVLEFEPAEGQMQLHVDDANGQRLASSQRAPLAAGPIDMIRFEAVPWHGDQGADYRFDSVSIQSATLDSDGDGLDDDTEIQDGTCTDPFNADSDGDGLTDGEGEGSAGTDPCNPDTDADGLTDGTEINDGTCTDPLNADSDGDGLIDGEGEAAAGTDPCNPDTDADGLTDGTEVHDGTCTDPLNADSDGDGLTDGEGEGSAGTDPCNPDTDGDGLPDGDEVHTHGTDPLNPDTDGDCHDDGTEVAAGSDPRDPAATPTPFGPVTLPLALTGDHDPTGSRLCMPNQAPEPAT